MCQKDNQCITWKMFRMHFVEISAKVSGVLPTRQYCYPTILKPFEGLGCEKIGKETLAATTRFWSLWISRLLCSFCTVNVCQNSVGFCDRNEYQTTPSLLKMDINLNLPLAINLNLLLIKQRAQSSTYWPFWWEARTFAGNPLEFLRVFL